MTSHRGKAVLRNHIEVDGKDKCVEAGAAQRSSPERSILPLLCRSIDQIHKNNFNRTFLTMMKALGYAVELYYVKGFVKGEDTE